MKKFRTILLLGGLVLSFPLFSATIYVNPKSKVKAYGTEVAPYRRLSRALNVLRPGDQLILAAGVYKEGIEIRDLEMIDGVMTTISGPETGEAIIDGSSLDPRDLPGEALIYLENVENLKISGLTLRNLKTSKKNVTPAAIHLSGRGKNITIEKNTIYGIQTLRTTRGGMNAHGIAVYGDSDKGAIENIKISENHLYDLKLGASEAIVVNGNVNGFEISKNYVHNVNNIAIDAIGYEGTSPLVDYARNGHIWGNTIHDIRAKDNPAYRGDYGTDGIYVDGGRDILIERNYVRNVDIGIELASEHSNGITKNVVVRNNIIQNSYYTGLAMGGYDSGRGKTDNCVVANNTFINNNTENGSVGEIMLQYYVVNSTIFNNAFYVGPSGVILSHRDSSGSKNNQFVTNIADGQGRAKLQMSWNDVSYSSLEAFNAGPGSKWNNSVGELELEDINSGKFSPTTSSSLIDSGTDNLAIGELDYLGQERVMGSVVDVGAIEFIQ